MFLAGHSVALVTYCVTKIIPTCSPVIGQFFEHQLIKSVNYDPSKSTSWKVLETVLSHLKIYITNNTILLGSPNHNYLIS